MRGSGRAAMVVNIILDANGNILNSDIFQAMVVNKAQLAYSMLQVHGFVAQIVSLIKLKSFPDLQKTLRLQHKIAQMLRKKAPGTRISYT